MKANLINQVKTMTKINFTARNKRNEAHKPTHQSEPMVKVPYSALMGLLMLASTTLGTTSCSKNSFEDDIIPPVVQQDTIVTSKPVQQEMSKMLSALGITAVSTKSLSSATGDIVEFSYKDSSADAIYAGKINLEESDENKVVYDVEKTDLTFVDEKTKQKHTFVKVEDGLRNYVEGVEDDGNYDMGYATYKLVGNTVEKTNGENKISVAHFKAGDTPNTIESRTTTLSDISIVKK